VTASAIIWAKYLSPEVVAESVSYLQRYDHPVFLNTDNEYWVDRYGARVQMIEERYNLHTEPFDKVSDAQGPIMRVSLAAPAVLLQQAAANVQVVLGNRINVSLASPDWLDLLAPDAGKGPALQMLQARLGLRPTQTMAVGDYNSDLSLFEHAEYRVAMGNAVAAVKEAATYVTASNNDDGVAQALQMLLESA
jgi:hydroxymethylpyrimidine pyrophosphatase-like HAD family hydrolase